MTSATPIRALRNRCSGSSPIEQRRGAVRRLGFAPIPGRRFNFPLTDLARDSSPGHRVGTPWLTTTVLARAPKDRRLGCVPTLPAATSSAASEFNPGASGCERWARIAHDLDTANSDARRRERSSELARAEPSSRARNSSRLSMRGARAGHTPMRAGRGDNAPLMKGRSSVGIGECFSIVASVAPVRWEANENTPKSHGRPI